MGALIHILEDDEGIAEILRFNLEREGYDVRWFTTLNDALDVIFIETPDLILLDWMLPDGSGVDLARKLRFQKETQNIPIIMLTARAEEDDHVRGIDAGADDYVTKPFSIRELLSRIKAQLRRSQPFSGGVIEFGDIQIDLEKMRIFRGKREVRLSPKEFEVLKLLIKRPGRVYSRDAILNHVWGLDEDVEIRTVDVVIGRLRRALKRGQEVDMIRTVRGVGYAWDERTKKL